MGWLVAAASAQPADREVILDQGLLRWKDMRQEIALFGVNYYTPFHWNYADLKAIGADPEQTIRTDLAHFRRLRLDLLRLHVFDREISDRQGNLLHNEHLRLFDYLIDQARRRGIYFVLTPIAWWGVPGPSDGFSDVYAMPKMTTDPTAWAAEGRYLEQFLLHTNRYTGLTYAQEPAIAALELINEPLYPHDITDAKITEYINALAQSVRAAGCRKPVFYNGWGGHLAAVGCSSIQGCTFGWYPSGLVSGHALRRNFLPVVADYTEMRSPELEGKAKGVYEFDAADVPGSYLYPAMARAFRCGGAQFAAQFQYDPLPLAPFNKGWQTHYLNLIFAPGKALSFMIASAAFHRLPRLPAQRLYPANNAFGRIRPGAPPEFRVSYEEDLSEHVSETTFLYSNNTQTRPPAPEKLERIAGCGSSPVVHYDGTGAYFLDRVAPGRWVLQVYPDAAWVNDPFGSDSFEREVSRVYWRARSIRIGLPDLGRDFAASQQGTGKAVRASQGEFTVSPGEWILARAGLKTDHPLKFDIEFVAPPERAGLKPAVWHQPAREWVSGRDLPIQLTVAAPVETGVHLQYRFQTGASWQDLTLRSERAYSYSGVVPGDAMRPGELIYRFKLATKDAVYWFPGGRTGASPEPGSAQQQGQSYSTTILDAEAPIRLLWGDEHFRADGQSGHREEVINGESGPAWRVSVPKFDAPPDCVSWRMELGEQVLPWQYRLATCKALRLRVRAGEPGTSALEVVLLEADGAPWGCNVTLTDAWQEVTVSWDKFRYFSHWQHPPDRGGPGDHFSPAELQAINFCFGTWLFPQRAGEKHAVEIEGVWLE